MEQTRVQLDQGIFTCSICLDLLKDPVTITCGHSYCMRCIETHWDGEDMKTTHSCPQCRWTFTSRPVLVKNTMLADVMEQLKKTGCGPAAGDHCYAGAEDVACDMCTGRKLKAVQSCLVCVVSYCHKHLQLHHYGPQFKKHKLVDPWEKLLENVCFRHGEVMKMFCRSEQQCICYLCSVDEHKGHNIVSAAAERTEKQKELEESREKLQQRIKDKHKHVKELQREAEIISCSADEAVKKNNKILAELIRLLEDRRRDVEWQIRSQQETEVIRVKELESKLEQEITELRRKDAEMDKLLHTHDHYRFILQYPSVSQLPEDPDSAHIHIHPQSYFKDVTTAVSELREKLQRSLTEGWTNISLTITQPQVLLQVDPQVLLPLQPQTRAEFMQYSRDIRLDPNTVNEHLLLSEENKRVTRMSQIQTYRPHPDRFSHWSQVLSRESLTGQCYWEVERSGWSVDIAVTYKDIKREGPSNECLFGNNDKSWALYCFSNSLKFRHNGVDSSVPGPASSRIGVYVDHSAGLLSFYSVSETMTLIHRVQTTFTKPLYAGVYVYDGSTVHFPKVQ